MSKNENIKNKSKHKLIKVKNMQGVYTSNISYHSTGKLDLADLTKMASEPLKKTVKNSPRSTGWAVVESSD